MAEPLLALARARAAADGLTNVEFRLADATATGLAAESFDAVLCVFGVFFAADMPAFVANMWRLVRPGGVLAITVWGPGLFEPANTVFWESVRNVEPALYKAFNPWDEITTPELLAGLFAKAGVPRASTQAVAGTHNLDTPDGFWDVVLGSGYRSTVEALGAAKRDQLQAQVLGELRARGVTALRTDVIYATVRRPR